MLDLMKLDVMRPERLVDINAPRQARGPARSRPTDSGLRLGALVRMAEAAEHPDGAARLSGDRRQSLKLAASAQIRNMASLGGNVLQRTRCSYFRDVAWPRATSASPAPAARRIDGVNRQHAVLGTSEDCIATYPGDFAQALIALDATVEIDGGPAAAARSPSPSCTGRRATRPHIETVLAAGRADHRRSSVPAGPWTRRSLYLKIRDRESYAFALASAAVALDMDGDTVREARIALGGVATVPWRATRGRGRARAASRWTRPARHGGRRSGLRRAPSRSEHNAFKVPLGQAHAGARAARSQRHGGLT